MSDADKLQGHTLPGVGHTPMLEAPLALRWLLHRFLRRCR